MSLVSFPSPTSHWLKPTLWVGLPPPSGEGPPAPPTATQGSRASAGAAWAVHRCRGLSLAAGSPAGGSSGHGFMTMWDQTEKQMA